MTTNLKKFVDKTHPDFTRTSEPGLARLEIHKFVEILGVKMTVEQKAILNSMLKHHGNLLRSKEVWRLEHANNVIGRISARIMSLAKDKEGDYLRAITDVNKIIDNSKKEHANNNNI